MEEMINEVSKQDPALQEIEARIRARIEYIELKYPVKPIKKLEKLEW